jgi:hypothetical protein
MNKSWLAAACALTFAAYSQLAFAQITSTSTGGSGGAGGTATGGTAAGGAATNSNTLSTTGGTGGSGGQGGLGGTGGTAAGGSATATGVQTGAISGTGNYQGADVTVNYITPVSPGGLKGLAAGVDPETGHFVNDNNVHYSGTQKIKNTADISVGGPASGPCNGFSGGLGVSVPGFAIGANASTVDPGCTARETARIAAMLGRMDIANAVLENTTVVQEALKAKAARLAAEAGPPAVAAPASQVQTFPLPAQSTSNRAVEEARLREQQRLAVEALQRKATMDKVYDNLTFTDAATQGAEKTPQQLMAEEATKKQAERAKRQEDQLKLERRLAALKSEPPERRINALTPEVPSMKLALIAPVAAAAAPVAPVSAGTEVSPTAAKDQQAQMPAGPAAAKDQQAQIPGVASNKVPEKVAVLPGTVPEQPKLDDAKAAKVLLNIEPVANKAPPSPEKIVERAPAPAAQAPTVPVQTPSIRDGGTAPVKEQPQLASQPTLHNVKVDKLIDMFGFGVAKPATDDVAPDAARKSVPKATEAAARPAGTQQTSKRTAPAEKAADEPKNKVPVQPADALNVAKVLLNVQ